MENIGKFEIEDAQDLVQIIKNDGWHPTQADRSDKSRLTIEDAISSPELGALLPRAVTEILIESQDPLMTLTPLLDRIAGDASIQEYKMPAVGVFKPEKVGEGMAYPEKNINMGGALSTANVGKWGLALAITEEAIQNSRWDILAMNVREVGRSFTREKEKNCANFLRQLGQPVFDNRNPTMSSHGTTRGRDEQGGFNGTMTFDDMFDMYTTLLHTGYQPDTMIVHPLTWMMFLKDPNLRAFTFQNGGGSVFGNFTGSAVNRNIRPAGTSGTVGMGNRDAGVGAPLSGNTPTLADFNGALNAAPVVPGLFPFPLRVVVSPYVWFDPASKLSDIILADSRHMGALVQTEDLTTDSWTDLAHDIRRMKFRERYGFMIYEEGMGMAVARNIKIDQNYFSLQPSVGQHDITTLSAHNPATALV